MGKIERILVVIAMVLCMLVPPMTHARRQQQEQMSELARLKLVHKIDRHRGDTDFTRYAAQLAQRHGLKLTFLTAEQEQAIRDRASEVHLDLVPGDCFWEGQQMYLGVCDYFGDSYSCGVGELCKTTVYCPDTGYYQVTWSYGAC